MCGTGGLIVRIVLTKGQSADCVQGPVVAQGFRPRAILADRAYDTEAMLRLARERDAVLVVPSKKNRKSPRPLYSRVYRRRNIIERIIGRLKDNRRIATRYEKTDSNFLAFLFLSAIIFNLNPTVNTA